MRPTAIAFLLAAALLGGCQSCSPPADDAAVPDQPGSDGVVVVLDPDTPDSEVVDQPIEATLRATGPFGVTPRHVLVQLNRPIFAADTIGTEPAGIDFGIEPELEGTLRVADRDLLEFTPSGGFPPGRSWTFQVKGVTHGSHSTIPDEPWATTVVSPAFAVVETRLRSRDRNRKKATVELVFSAPIDSGTLAERLTADIGGVPTRINSIVQGEPHSAVAEIEVNAPAASELKLGIDLTAGVPWIGDAKVTAPPHQRDFALLKGPEVEIQSISLREGANGFYVEVVCNDDAAGGERYWWDRDMHRSYWVSSRCLLDEDTVERVVRTDPSTKLSVAPGPAGFRVFGGFDRGPLEVTIDAGALTVDGGVVYKGKSQKFTVPARSALVSFTSKGRYLPRASWKNLGIQHMNVDNLTLSVRHVPESNLVFWLTGDEPMGERTSNLVLETELAVKNPPDAMASSWIPVGSMLPKPKPGVYELELAASGRSDAARLMLTDMHLVAKATRPGPDDRYLPGVRVWALDVHDGTSLSGVSVRLVRASGKTLGSCTTVGDRGCEIPVDQDPVDPSAPVALIAKRGEDLSYIKLADLELDTPDDTSGIPYTSVLKHQAPLYTDRGVYRPGDTAHLAAVVRTDAFVAPEAELPVVVKLFDPKGREIKKRVLQTDVAGMVATDIAFGDYQITGHYRATAEIGGMTAGETRFQVEEFVPERLKVTAAGTEAGFLLGDEGGIEVTGEWLFGGAAKKARVELSCSLQSTSFTPKGHDGYHFGPAHLMGTPHPITLGTVEDRLDDEGKATLVCPAPEGSTGSLGPAQLVAQAAVFEGESGRTTVARATVPMHPARTWIGLDTPATKAERGKSFTVSGRVVDWAGKPAGAGQELTVEVYRMEEEFSWWYDDEGSSQQRQLRPARELRDTVKVDDKGLFTWKVTPGEDSAGALVRVRGEGMLTELFVEGTGRRYYWSDSGEQSVDSTPRPLRPVGLDLELPDRVKVGEVTEVSVIAPYAGRILWTVETDSLLDAVWVDAKAGSNEWRFKVDRFTPNVYVSAFLVKDPHLESAAAFLPDRAFGVESVEVAPEAFEQQLSLKVPDEVQPFSPLTVEIDVGSGAGPTSATIAVVDEGILSLTKFEDPDPLGVVFRQRALGVRSFETIGWTLLMDPSGPSSTTGGDGDSAPARVQMVKPVALWSGVLQTDAEGKASHTFDMPGYRGKVRVMVVTASAQRVGHASEQVHVRDPLVLQTTLPRFLLTGDTADIPVMVSNLSGKPQEVTVALTATELQVGAVPDVTDGRPPVPILEFLGSPTGKLSLGVGEQKTGVFRVKTRDIPGAAHLEIIASAGALRSREELDIPIQSATSDVREVKRRSLDGGTNALLADYDGWLDGTDRTTLWVTSNPYAQAMTHLRYLVRYPFG